MIFILRMGHSEQIHRLLVRVGGAHWYQVLVCLLCSIIALESGSTSLVNVFLFYLVITAIRKCFGGEQDVLNVLVVELVEHCRHIGLVWKECIR